MTDQWLSNAVMKVHESCGGLVRWVEAYDDPGVGFVGECLECGEDRIVVERIIPVNVPKGHTSIEVHNEHEIETLRELEWDDTATWSANQDRLQSELGIKEEVFA